MAVPDAILEHGLNDVRAYRSTATHHMSIENGDAIRCRTHDGAEDGSRLTGTSRVMRRRRRSRGIAQLICRGGRPPEHRQGND